nr:MAG TPA: hypothetical protein [Caudoviricetes sp.]
MNHRRPADRIKESFDYIPPLCARTFSLLVHMCLLSQPPI